MHTTRTTVVGKPARYATAHRRQNLTSAAAWAIVGWFAVAGAVASASTSVRATADHTHPTVWSVVVFLCGAIYLITRRNRVSKTAKAGQQGVGIRAEQEVAAELRRIGTALVINGADGGHIGDIDHVIAFQRDDVRGVLAVIETKAGGGRVSIATDGRILTRGGDHTVFGDPVAQVRREAASLTAATGHHYQVQPIVCVAWMPASQTPFRVGEVIICGKDHLDRLLRHDLPTIPMSIADVQRIKHSIALAS